jgi:hypothetical protein
MTLRNMPQTSISATSLAKIKEGDRTAAVHDGYVGSGSKVDGYILTH